jgi:hypothetical protein
MDFSVCRFEPVNWPIYTPVYSSFNCPKSWYEEDEDERDEFGGEDEDWEDEEDEDWDDEDEDWEDEDEDWEDED